MPVRFFSKNQVVILVIAREIDMGMGTSTAISPAIHAG
jgi:hypothetical protein